MNKFALISALAFGLCAGSYSGQGAVRAGGSSGMHGGGFGHGGGGPAWHGGTGHPGHWGGYWHGGHWGGGYWYGGPWWPSWSIGVGLGAYWYPEYPYGYPVYSYPYYYSYGSNQPYVYSAPPSPAAESSPADAVPRSAQTPESPGWVPANPGSGTWVPDSEPYRYEERQSGETVKPGSGPQPAAGQTVTITRSAEGPLVYRIGR